MVEDAHHNVAAVIERTQSKLGSSGDYLVVEEEPAKRNARIFGSFSPHIPAITWSHMRLLRLECDLRLGFNIC